MTRAGAVLVALLVVSACSSTTKQSAQPRPQEPSSAPISGAPSGVASGAPAAGSRSATPSAPATAQARTAGGRPVVGPAIRRGPVKVGIFTQANSAELAAALGVSTLQNGNEREMADALVADVNRRGGVAGSKVEPVYFRYDPQSDQRDAGAIQQAACAHFTEDNRVVAVLLGWHSFTDHQLATCLQRRGVIAVNSAGIMTGDRRALSGLPDHYAPPGAILDRHARSYVDALAAQGFFARGANVGLIAIGLPDFRRVVTASLIPALKRRGVSLTEQLFYPPANSQSEIAGQSASVSNAVLRFRSRDVQRVMFLQLGINGPFYFMQAAESQGYRPRYGLSTTDAPAALASLAPRPQLEGTLGMGWIPVNDLTAGPRDKPSARRQQCLDLLKRTGEAFTNRTVEYVGLTFCDSIWFLESAAKLGGGPLGRATFRAGVAKLGTTYRSPLPFTSRFSRDKRDGADSYRNLRFESGCGCFAYSGSVRPLS